ncbi:hypothetical protein JOD57_004882 [Geodermatophilus bullaregiensis]|uniref:hypothetical protein n=1 Tax=Geodermatophilus bullaregiensis TaxID=1564160 RepID=UPI001959D5D6|nr:hypothetical protein [Geodermatophilus bullaregiensis]MBM7809045.1 hypothetical protein [Geodermatophilus bullaregiensis]
MDTSAHESSSPFQRALEAARVLGRADGRLAAGLEPAGEPAPVGPWCHGLGPEDLARLVWDLGAAAPAGVVLNAPLWYAQGFRESLACARAQQHRRAVDGRPPAAHCRPPAANRPPCAPVCHALPAPVRPGAVPRRAGARRRDAGGPGRPDHGRP